MPLALFDRGIADNKFTSAVRLLLASLPFSFEDPHQFQILVRRPGCVFVLVVYRGLGN